MMPSAGPDILRTERLILRPFVEADAPRLAALAGTWRVADKTLSIPHPYSPEQALNEIRRFQAEFQTGVSAHFVFAPADAPKDEWIGEVLLKLIDRVHSQAELGFWIDEASSGRGYVTEAAGEALRYAFGPLALNRVNAHSMVRNAASAMVLARLGFRHEGCLRQSVRKWSVFEDVDAWSLLRSDPESAPYR
jgi:[ribosomal protein S5]-alanine N-acetyltransferase